MLVTGILVCHTKWNIYRVKSIEESNSPYKLNQKYIFEWQLTIITIQFKQCHYKMSQQINIYVNNQGVYNRFLQNAYYTHILALIHQPTDKRPTITIHQPTDKRPIITMKKHDSSVTYFQTWPQSPTARHTINIHNTII